MYPDGPTCHTWKMHKSYVVAVRHGPHVTSCDLAESVMDVRFKRFSVLFRFHVTCYMETLSRPSVIEEGVQPCIFPPFSAEVWRLYREDGPHLSSIDDFVWIDHIPQGLGHLLSRLADGKAVDHQTPAGSASEFHSNKKVLEGVFRQLTYL